VRRQKQPRPSIDNGRGLLYDVISLSTAYKTVDFLRFLENSHITNRTRSPRGFASRGPLYFISITARQSPAYSKVLLRKTLVAGLPAAGQSPLGESCAALSRRSFPTRTKIHPCRGRSRALYVNSVAPFRPKHDNPDPVPVGGGFGFFI